MHSARSLKLFVAPAAKSSHKVAIFWLFLSLTFAATYGILALQDAFSADYVVQDDARQHVFWMQRFLDSQLFPQDLIADYFQSVSPAGYATLYRLMAAVGIPPLIFSKILPLILGLITTVYCFGVTLQLLPVPFAGFLATVLLNQSLWMQDGLISATPKAFVYPLFLPFLYYLLKQNLLGTAGAIALLGLFYPQYVFIAAGILILQLIQWKNRRFSLSFPAKKTRFFAINIAVAFFILLPYAISTSEFSPTISLAEAKTLPEFLPGGRTQFFIANAWDFWFHGRSGIGLSAALTPAFMALGFLLPILRQFPQPFPLAKSLSIRVRVLGELLLASLGMFFAAHALLFQLHLPSRYTQHSLRMVMAFSAAIAITLLLDAAGKWARTLWRKLLFFPLTSLLLATLIFYPQWAMSNFPWTYYQTGTQPQLYGFLQQQPKDSLIASLSEEANNLPTFAHRSILAGREYAIPYHLGYYAQFRDRTEATIAAQYTPELATVQQFLDRYRVDLWLVDKGAFTPSYLAENSWLRQYPAAQQAIAQLKSPTPPAIVTLMNRCSIFENYGTVVLDSRCILNSDS
ncbi:hypothetical protein [Phormidium sp. CCY1219]|uniref:hypothetical protein n=1 Tax=Phormidium sp. CCY1219 TaxID=2886104 RepID=UPI002D1F00F0|nr:hypothetical protein [Phormidium sp. CCY1219]MEB3830910.1 hypothetical protein [Phormidium sp. CCY1219]